MGSDLQFSNGSALSIRRNPQTKAKFPTNTVMLSRRTGSQGLAAPKYIDPKMSAEVMANFQ
jgi:hypothetical protein